MRLSTANHSAPRREPQAEPCGWLEARIAGFLEKIAAVAPGRLFSLSFDLPPQVFDVAEARGDRSWLAPDDGVSFFGGGSVSGYGSTSFSK